MPRTVTPELDVALAGPVTQPGYLLELIAGMVTLRLCDIGTISNVLGTWTHNDFTISGVGGDQGISINMQNLDNAIGALVLGDIPLGDIACTLWKFDRARPDDAVLIGSYLPQGAQVGIDRVQLAVKMLNLVYRFAPVFRIIPRDGFKFAMRPGEILLWGAQRIFIKERV